MTKECQGDIQVPPSLQKGSKMIEKKHQRRHKVPPSFQKGHAFQIYKLGDK